MREMVLKNLVSDDKKRREIFISESLNEQGAIQKLEKRTIYIIKEVLKVTPDFNLQLILNQRQNEGKMQPKQTYFTRISNSNKSEEKFIYKVYGDSYAMIDDKLFIIRLVQYLKIEFIHSLT